MSDAADRLRIIGIGSPFAEDRSGLQAIERLRDEPALAALPFVPELLALDRPGSALVTCLEGVETVVLIDAMRSERPAATVARVAADELLLQAGLPSSHDLGVAEALALARALGALPPQLLIYGIEAGEGIEPADWYPALLALLRQDLAALPA